MCGIAGFHIKEPKSVKDHRVIEMMADELLLGIQQRGKQATGFVAVSGDGKTVEIDKAPISADEFIKDRKRIPKNSKTVLLHTRWATKGDINNHANNHPVIYGTCFAIHNGSIWNDDRLFEEHGLERHAEVDTEIVPALLSGLDDWSKAGDILHKLHGAAAVAVIDPVKQAGELLLKRIDYSPLIVYENKNFILWASTESAMRNAWGKVLGTPPQSKQFHTMPESTIWHVNGKKVKVSTFEPPFAVKSTQKQQKANTSRTTRSSGTSGKPHGLLDLRRSGDESSTIDLVADWGLIRSRVQALRKEGRGIAILESERSRYEREDLEDSRGVVSWEKCHGCMETVLGVNFQKYNNTYWRCSDCAFVCDLMRWGRNVDVIQEARKIAERQADQRVKTLSVMLTSDEREELNEFGRLEAMAHELALREVSTLTGLDTGIIDYLVFRPSDEYLKGNKKMGDLADELDEMYQEQFTDAWESLEEEKAEDAATVVEEAEAPKSGDTNVSGDGDTGKVTDGDGNDRKCPHHDVVMLPGEDECFRCAADRDKTVLEPGEELPDHTIDWENLDGMRMGDTIEKCGGCDHWKIVGKSCRVCSKKTPKVWRPISYSSKETKTSTAKRKTAGPGTKKFDLKACHGYDGAGCMMKPVITVGDFVAYCNKCYSTCASPGCILTMNASMEKAVVANHMDAEGKRYCHYCIRGVKGIKADQVLIGEGVKVSVQT